MLLRPRQSQVLTLPFLPQLSGPEYFEDVRLSGPGRFTISLRLDECRLPMLAKETSPAFLGPATTNEIVIERIEPAGSDATVWKRMQEVTNGKWLPTRSWPGIINEIVIKYPESNYYPYAIAAASFGMEPAVYRKHVARALEQFPNSPVFEVLAVSFYRQMGSSCDTWDKQAAAVCKRAEAHSKDSKRPTTRIRMFGREDVASPPCLPDDECVD